MDHKPHRFFLDLENKQDNKIVIRDNKLLHQFLKVLRFKESDLIICLFNDHQEYLVKITKISKKQCLGEIMKKQKNKNELPFNLTLYQALPNKKDTWERVISKATELGVTTIVPVLSQRSYGKYPTSSPRLQNILKESAESAERGCLPSITSALKLSKMTFSKQHVFLADSFNKKAPLLSECLINAKNLQEIGIIIGPEGGFTKNEVNYLVNNGANTVNLGPRILRIETAVIVALGQITFFSEKIS